MSAKPITFTFPYHFGEPERTATVTATYTPARISYDRMVPDDAAEMCIDDVVVMGAHVEPETFLVMASIDWDTIEEKAFDVLEERE